MNPLDITSKQLADRTHPRLFREAVTAAIAAARIGGCAKDKRGAAVWHHDHGHISAASNGPPAPFVCDGSDVCRDACGKLAVHAEERALLAYLRCAGRCADGRVARGMQVIHIHITGDVPVMSGPPSCITCSRSLLEAGVSWVWLWHETGWAGYAAADFHALSLAHEKHRLPVMRADWPVPG